MGRRQAERVIAALGALTIVALTVAILSKRVSPIVALIAIPVTVSLVIVCGQFTATRWIAVLLSSTGADQE